MHIDGIMTRFVHSLKYKIYSAGQELKTKHHQISRVISDDVQITVTRNIFKKDIWRLSNSYNFNTTK